MIIIIIYIWPTFHHAKAPSLDPWMTCKDQVHDAVLCEISKRGGAVGIVGIIQEKPWAKTLEKPTLKIFEVDFAIYFRLVVLLVYELFRRQI